MPELVAKLGVLDVGGAGEKEVVVANPLREEAYHVLACLY